MKVKIVSIGNSKGIRIPRTVLLQCHIESWVEMKVEDDHITIASCPAQPRSGWEEDFKKMHENKDDQLIIDDAIDMGEWTW